MPNRVTINDVAERAGVHKATVSRALNSATEHQVNAATVRRIQRVARELGYVPNIVARGLRTHSSMTVGVIIPDLTNPLFPPMLRGMEQYLTAKGYTALITNTDGNADHEAAALESLLGRRVDGVIFATGTLQHDLLQDAHRRGIRAVLLNRDAPNVPYPLVASDNAAGTRMSVQHLVELGHRDILHLSGPQAFSTTVVRAQAFSAAMSTVPDARPRLMPTSALSIQAGYEAAQQLIAAGGPLPTAIMAGNDLLAVGVLRAFREHGIRCPQDVSLMGFNDIPFTQDLYPPLTTIRVPTFDMGSEAARLLLESLTSTEPMTGSVTLPVSLVVRGSTAPVRAAESRG